MNRRAVCGSQAILCALLLSCFGCTPADGAGPGGTTGPAGTTGPTGPVTYNRIIIDTYDPLSPGNTASNNTYMELWRSSDSAALATDDSGVSRTSPPPTGFGYAYIDYTSPLSSGDYYVLVKASSGGTLPIGYAIRVLTAPDIAYVGWALPAPTVETVSDAPSVGPPPASNSYKTIVFNNTTSDSLTRYIPSSGVNWVKIHLP